MYYYDFISMLYPLAIIGGIIWAIVYFARRKHDGKPGITTHEWKKFAMIASLAIVMACFIGFFTAMFFPTLSTTGPFAMMLVLSAAVIVAGVMVKERPAVGYGLILGGVFNLVYNVALNIGNLNPAIAVVFVGIALFAMIVLAYKKFQVEEAK